MSGIARKWLLSTGWSWAKGPQFAQARPSNVINFTEARRRRTGQSNFGYENRSKQR
ncbi:MAG: hypothetical protein KDK05_25105 [Candidatus Competibacteraceae bacterium]|nr:hypothetical protein [Candidatus Competibacteraceae bacterium]